MQKVLESGVMLDLSMCSFDEGNRLMKAVAREIKNTKIELAVASMDKLGDLFKAQAGDGTLNTIKNLVTGMLASDEIEAALWPCIMRGTYDGLKINKDTFEDEKARADYLPILKEALVFNLSPFFKSLKSFVQDITAVSTGFQK